MVKYFDGQGGHVRLAKLRNVVTLLVETRAQEQSQYGRHKHTNRTEIRQGPYLHEREVRADDLLIWRQDTERRENRFTKTLRARDETK